MGRPADNYVSRIMQRAGLCWVTTIFYELRARSLAEPELPPGLSIEMLSADNINLLTEVWHVDAQELKERLQRGDLCYAGFLDGRIAHYSWVQLSGIHRVTEANLSIPVPPEEFWIYHCRTSDWARGHGIYPQTLIRIMSDQFGSGRALARIYTTTVNALASNRNPQPERSALGIAISSWGRRKKTRE